LLNKVRQGEVSNTTGDPQKPVTAMSI
jgi:hypothetical protein